MAPLPEIRESINNWSLPKRMVIHDSNSAVDHCAETSGDPRDYNFFVGGVD